MEFAAIKTKSAYRACAALGAPRGLTENPLHGYIAILSLLITTSTPGDRLIATTAYQKIYV
ncbi:hypothetical protein [Nostoc sp. FACHB-110]|uniref:hypothetical protein n=1 Tax=Nostoc sp. FACHB-110 TaxID=2692834 RepID=UPI0016863B9C|nr:hypothetical protein [Nostoc sp. FACHB-110]MBD2436157.1 hypothetical protein [Nostoc sp. FACHB-110]